MANDPATTESITIGGDTWRVVLTESDGLQSVAISKVEPEPKEEFDHQVFYHRGDSRISLKDIEKLGGMSELMEALRNRYRMQFQLNNPAPSTPAPLPNVYPAWFSAEVERLREIVEVSENNVDRLLSESRKDFQTAWINFFQQVQNLISLHVAIYTVVVAIVYFVLKDAKEHQYLLCGGGVMLFLAYIVGTKSKIVCSATFSFYVAAAVYSCQLHLAANAATHRWFDMVSEHLAKLHPKTGKRPVTKQELLEVWQSPTSTHHAYTSLIEIMKWVSLVGCVVMFIVGSWPYWQQWREVRG